jgi:thiol-disulfide isomerase/thioredoxin
VTSWSRFLWLAGLGLSLGCGALPKGDSARTSGAGNDRLPAADLTGRNPRAGGNGILAGQVIDNFNQRRGSVAITVQATDGSDSKQAITNDQGYFTLQGLQPGKKYKLSASSKSGNVQISGATEATTPNVVVLIKLSDSRQEADGKPTGFSGSVGGLHSSVADPSASIGREGVGVNQANNNPATTGRGDRLGPASDLNQPPSTPAAPPNNARLGRPLTTDPQNSAAGVEARPEYITQNQAQTTPLPKSSPPAFMTIPGPGNHGPVDASPKPRAEAGLPGPYFEQPLLDLDQRPTTIAAYRGRLTLVDVWGTWCQPCIRSMPELVALQRRYEGQGLVVVGIATREQGDAAARSQHIRFTANRQGVSYPIFMEPEYESIVRAFRIRSWPTLILLDEQGKEVWRAEGLTPQSKQQLESELQRRLAGGR